jgi:hypothetical protein
MDGSDSPRVRAEKLLEILAPHVDAATLAWLAARVSEPGAVLSRNAFFGAYAGAGRRFGDRRPTLAEAERQQLLEAGLAVPESWSLSHFARAVLLLCAVDALPAAEHVALVTEVIRKGDSAERAAALSALCCLPSPERFVDIAVDACRSHVIDVFSAIACDNAFPAAQFPQIGFNQLVMKVLFVELSLERVVNWRKRCNAQLFRMARDYEAERRAAFRPVPSDLTLLRSMEPPP